jgi:hypothetical protein
MVELLLVSGSEYDGDGEVEFEEVVKNLIHIVISKIIGYIEAKVELLVHLQGGGYWYQLRLVPELVEVQMKLVVVQSLWRILCVICERIGNEMTSIADLENKPKSIHLLLYSTSLLHCLELVGHQLLVRYLL